MNRCKICGKEFDDAAREFCSLQCEENHLKSLRKKLHEAVKDDKGHTQKLSKT